MRVTKSMIEKRFLAVCKLMGKYTVPMYRDQNNKLQYNVGAWILDYNATYGGYIIAEICNNTGGEHHPIIPQRLKASAFLDMLCGIESALKIREE